MRKHFYFQNIFKNVVLKILLVLIISLAALLNGVSQSSQEYSTLPEFVEILKQSLRNTHADSVRMHALVYLTNIYQTINPDSARIYAYRALEEAKQLGLLQRQLGFTGFLASSYLYQGNLPKALELCLEAIEMGKEQPSEFAGVGPNYEFAGTIHFLIGDYDRAIKYFHQEASLINDPWSSAFAPWSLAQVFIAKNQLDSALFYLDQSYQAFSRINDEIYPKVYSIYPHWYDLRAEVYLKQNKIDAALADLHQSLHMSLLNDEKFLSSETYNRIARVYKDLNQSDSCIYYAEKALNQAQYISNAKEIFKAGTLLSEQYEKNDPAKALHYFKLAIDNKNKLYGAGNLQTLRDMIEQNDRRAQEVAANEIAFNNRLRQYLLLTGLIFLFILALILIRNNKRVKKVNRLINKQKITLENTLNQLKATQSQLVQSEKMASLGQLTAGIAHEINNPINYVYAGADSLKLNIEDMKGIIDKQDELIPDDKRAELEEYKEEIEFEEVLKDLDTITTSIKNGASRTKEIVKGLRTFSRLDEDALKDTNIHENLDSTIALLQNQTKDRIQIKKKIWSYSQN